MKPDTGRGIWDQDLNLQNFGWEEDMMAHSTYELLRVGAVFYFDARGIVDGC